MKEIILRCGSVVLVDDEDYPALSRFTWYLNKGYAYRSVYDPGIKRSHNIPIHREIMKTPKGADTDHINGNPLDNRRENLRICTRAQNAMNARKSTTSRYSKYKGVTFNKRAKLFVTQVKKGGKHVYCKYFKNEIDAAKAYNAAALVYFGEFAKLNSIPNEI